MSAAIQIVPADTPGRVPLVRELFREYAAEIEVDLCFQGFEGELATLPGRYAPPEGRLFLALCNRGTSAGCIGLRSLGRGACEMKRLFVRPGFRRVGAGRILAKAAISAAREIGYGTMKLDTLSSMQPALALYRSLGFTEVEPYYPNPCGNVVFLALALKTAGHGAHDK